MKQNAEENASLLMLKLIMTSDNCFRKALAQNLFIQGSTSSLHFPYLLSDTVLQFPALALTFSAHIIRQWFQLYQIELTDSSLRIVRRIEINLRR